MGDPIESSTEPSSDRDPRVGDGAARQTLKVLAGAFGRQAARQMWAGALQSDVIVAEQQTTPVGPSRNRRGRRAAI